MLGPQTLHVLAEPWHPTHSPIVAAALDAGANAWVDGASALRLAGLEGWMADTIDIALPAGISLRPRGGVTLHRLLVLPPRRPEVVPYAVPAFAAIRAAGWARTDRQAAAILSMTVQQRLAQSSQMVDAFSLIPRVRRRATLKAIVADIAGGSQSIGEIDFVAECRRRCLPLPDRQEVREGANGRYYLDVLWASAGLAVEVDGSHHYVGDNPERDALRQNDITMTGLTVMRIPRLSLRTNPDPFFAQIEAFLSSKASLLTPLTTKAG